MSYVLSRTTTSLRTTLRSPAWAQVLALSWTETISWGILYYTFSVFLVPMQAGLGWSRSALTGAFSLALLVSGIAGIPAGRWLDRHGPRGLMTAGSVVATLLLLAWAGTSSLPLFYAVWAGLGATMAAVLYEPAFATVAAWFPDRGGRGRALTVLTFFGGFASVIFIPLANALIESLGWRQAIVALAAILAAGTIAPHALILRPHTRSTAAGRQEATGIATGDALRGATFWWLTVGNVLLMSAVVAVTIHLIPYLQEEGFSATFAASAAGFVGLMALPGRLIFTPLGGRLPRTWVTAAIFLLEAAAIVVLVLADSRADIVLFVILFGAGFGAITPARAALVADLYGARAYGSISGVLAFFVTAARAIGPVGASLLVGWWGGYTAVLWFLATLAILGAGAVLLARQEPGATAG